MEALKLNEDEHRYYEELFKLCDSDKSAKIPKLVVGELFATSGLPTDVLLQIADLCGASRLGYFGRSQFYISLKLIAVAQHDLPLTFDSFSVPLALPSFNMGVLNMKLASYDSAAVIGPPEMTQVVQPTGTISGSGVLPPPPTKKHVRNMSGTRSLTDPPSNLQLHTQMSTPATNSHMVQSPSAVPQEASGWASFGVQRTEAQSIASQPVPVQSPPQPTVPSPGVAFPENLGGSRQSFKFDTASLSSADYATSEAESVEDIWSINDEQREYYVNQFKTMQPDLSAAINGAVGKEFFEKSKLPTRELSTIWKLSDVNRDGALTLQEFCTAMHLVVLRRNDVELPTTLPDSLMPYTPASSEPFAADLQHGETPSPVQSPEESWSVDQSQWKTTEAVPPTSSPPAAVQTQWTGSSGLPSPSHKPVHFDVAPSNDPDIIHPVAMRMSPTNQLLDNLERTRTFSEPKAYDPNAPPARHRSTTESVSDHITAPALQSRPRPTPKKAQSVPGPAAERLLINPPPIAPQQSAPVQPPQVPPRTRTLATPDQDELRDSRHHSDSYSRGDNASASITQEANFADFSSEFGKPQNEVFDGQHLISEPSALEMKDGEDATARMQAVMKPTVEAPRNIIHQYSIRDKREIQASIRQQKERNSMLVRLNGELNQELQEVMEQRISLEIQLEHLKPC